MPTADLAHLLQIQDGVVSRAQVLACGGHPHDIKRHLRRREWATLIDGVYVDHTGDPTWQQRAVAGVLHAGRLDKQHHPIAAALGGHAALHAATSQRWRHHREGAPIEVCIGVRRTLRPVTGYRFVRVARLDGRVEWLRTPPRLRADEAALDLALAAHEPLDAVGVLADACQSRCTSAAEVLAALRRRPRVGGRSLWISVLTDIADGTCSVLEHQFLTRVIRAHGLPLPSRQQRRLVEEDGGRSHREFRDPVWDPWGTVVELDGRLFHDNATQRDVDLDRDLDEVVDGRLAIRLGWGQCSHRGCRTAGRLALVLRARGWQGHAVRCPDCHA